MWNSQTVLLALIKKGLTREAAYKLVQDAAMKTWEVKHAGRDDADFVEQLKADPAVAKHFKPGELEKLCSLDFHFKEVKNRFKKRRTRTLSASSASFKSRARNLREPWMDWLKIGVWFPEDLSWPV
jgi:hypothetical protein